MSTSTLTRARNHYRNQQKVALAGVRAVRRVVKSAGTPAAAAPTVATTLATYQLASAVSGAAAVSSEVARAPLSVPQAFAGTTQLGWPIETPIETILDRLAADYERDLQRLTDQMLAGLDLFVQSEIIAAGADAASVEIFAENTHYVRVLVLPSCKRCVVLAGRVYRSEEAFPRHPLCDCEHWPVGSEEEARAAGLVLDPMEAFERGQIRGLSSADIRAIRDGADIQEVVNATRGGGRRPQGMTNAITAEVFGRTVKATTEGTTRRAAWRKANPKLPIRLRPESIYEHAKDRADALRLLRLYGYIK